MMKSWRPRGGDKESAEKPLRLCFKCSKINFSQFDSASVSASVTGTVDTTTDILSLYDVIKHQRKADCEFCCLLFDAIALHDPFEHPAIKDHMPDDLRGKTFQSWAAGLRWFQDVLNSPHPFGKGRNIVEFENNNDPEAPIKEVRREDLEMAMQTGIIVSAGAAGGTIEAASQQKDNKAKNILFAAGSAGKVFGSMMSMMNFKLPAAVTVVMHNIADVDSGLLKIAVWGYGNRVQAPLSLLSSFNLRIASDYTVDETKDGSSLRYGKQIGETVNVGEDCGTWLEYCLEHHGDSCAVPDWFSKLPAPGGKYFRLLDVQEGKVVQVNFDHQSLEYAALSYVWGEAGARALKLQEHNVSLLSEPGGIYRQSESPASTIMDAIKVSTDLGFRYLWIDSLCVVQKYRDDDELKANSSEIKQMGSIFGHASIVIVAAHGKDADAGLCGVNTSRVLPPQIARAIAPNVNVLFPVQYDEPYGKWDTRGWTFQEKLLSRRTLVFGSKYVSFHCRHDIFREDMPAKHAGNGPPPLPLLSMPTNSDVPPVTYTWEKKPVLLRSPFFQEYAKLLEQYTSREMTKSKDILSGVMGLLRVLEDMRTPDKRCSVSNSSRFNGTTRNDHTLYGLPEEFLDLALLWQPPAIKGTYLTKRTSDRLPSWSWVGWEVGKDPDDARQDAIAYHVHPGVRFEQPFWVATDADMSLKKVKATGRDAEERFRPLILWHKCLKEPPQQPDVRMQAPSGPTGFLTLPNRRPPPPPPPNQIRRTPPPPPSNQIRRAPPPLPNRPSSDVTRTRSTRQDTAQQDDPVPPIELIPVNACGLGFLCGSKTVDNHFLENAAQFLGLSNSSKAKAPEIDSTVPLDNRHLVCMTQLAKFRLRSRSLEQVPRTEVLWKREENELLIDRELDIVEFGILDQMDQVVGYMIPTDQHKSISTDHYDFIILFESQYWGNEQRVDVVDFPLFNVMAVERDNRKEFATRLGLGKIAKPAWQAANNGIKRVILK